MAEPSEPRPVLPYLRRPRLLRPLLRPCPLYLFISNAIGNIQKARNRNMRRAVSPSNQCTPVADRPKPIAAPIPVIARIVPIMSSPCLALQPSCVSPERATLLYVLYGPPHFAEAAHSSQKSFLPRFPRVRTLLPPRAVAIACPWLRPSLARNMGSGPACSPVSHRYHLLSLGCIRPEARVQQFGRLSRLSEHKELGSVRRYLPRCPSTTSTFALRPRRSCT